MTERYRRPQRCGWCIDNIHSACVVVVAMGDRWKPPRSEFYLKPHTGTIWRCECGCEWSLQAKCPDCQRVGGDLRVLRNGRCVDREDCRRVAAEVSRRGPR